MCVSGYPSLEPYIGFEYYITVYLILEAVALKPHSPVKAHGPLMLPPISLPIPKIEPPEATKADSPPEEPPDIRVVS